MIESPVYIWFVTNRSRPIVNARGHLTVSPTMINPEEKNCVVTSGNTTIPVSWWVFQPVQHRHSASSDSGFSAALFDPLLPEDGLPHFLRMHKHSPSWQEALIRNILSISSHGINMNRGLLLSDLFFKCLHVALRLLWSRETTCWIAALLAVFGLVCRVFGSRKGERKQTTVACCSTWLTLRSRVCSPPPSAPHTPFPDPDP